jgi:hypothetical protein
VTLELAIKQLAVDSGYATTEVYQWARRQGQLETEIKGDSRAPALVGIPASIEIGTIATRYSLSPISAAPARLAVPAGSGR